MTNIASLLATGVKDGIQMIAVFVAVMGTLLGTAAFVTWPMAAGMYVMATTSEPSAVVFALPFVAEAAWIVFVVAPLHRVLEHYGYMKYVRWIGHDE